MINLCICNPDGYIVGDQILFHLGDDEFSSVGSVWANNWIRYHAETIEHNIETETPYGSYIEDATPPRYRFQVQDLDALDVVKAVLDHSLPDISFFEMDIVEVGGDKAYVLGHAMAATPGVELFGPYAHHDEVLDGILATGERFEIR